jgi:SNF2 family DNA or RNA helicase
MVRYVKKIPPGEKALLFSQWTSFLDLVEDTLSRNGIGYERYDGDMNEREREEAIQNFSHGPDVRVLIGSLQSMGTGLNLVEANHVLFMDRWFNPFLEDQARDRTHRIGQTRPVTAVWFSARGSVDEAIYKIQERKRAEATTCLQGVGNIQTSVSNSLNQEEMISIMDYISKLIEQNEEERKRH